MRKISALAMVALLSLTIALAAVGCSSKKDESATPPAETAAPPAETSMDTSMTADSSMHSDSTMGH
jgi:hypothetical protein